MSNKQATQPKKSHLLSGPHPPPKTTKPLTWQPPIGPIPLYAVRSLTHPNTKTPSFPIKKAKPKILTFFNPSLELTVAVAMAAASPHRFSPLSTPLSSKTHLAPFKKIRSLSYPLRSSHPNLSQSLSLDHTGGSGGAGGLGGSGGGDNGGSGDANSGDGGRSNSSINPIALFIEGWRSRVAADPEFPFKVLMEELVGVSATAAGDMATRPNFGLGELDFVFSTLVVGSIVNFTLMYLLAPTSSSLSPPNSLPSYIFEPGPFSLGARLSTFVYKGVVFAMVGFVSGLAGTAISNGLVAMREKGKGMESSKSKKKGPKTVLNAATWAAHMGLSSNLRYQTLNGVEFVLAKLMPAAMFKAVVVVLRCLNNVAGGMSFVMLGRMMGSQKVEEEEEEEEEHLKVK